MNGKKLIPVLIGLVICIMGFFYQKATVNAAQTQVNELKEQLAGLENDYAVKVSSQKAENEKVIQQATGLEQEKKSSDDEKMAAFMADTVNWSSYAEYKERRANVIEKYNPNEDFLNMFFPEVGVAVSADGHEYNRIDQSGLSLSFSKLDSYIINIQGGVYSYFAIVTVTNNGNTASNVTFALTYDIDENGNVSNLKGIM